MAISNAFAPIRPSVTQLVELTSVNVAIPARPQGLRIYNAGLTPVFVRFAGDDDTATALVTDMPVAPGAVEVFLKGLDTRIAMIRESGTGNAYLTVGDGI
jgi:hypothetical protein